STEGMPSAVWAIGASSASSVVATITPSRRTHGAPAVNRDFADAVDVASSARNQPLNPAVVASPAHSASAAPRPPPGVKTAVLTNARRPVAGVSATGTTRSVPKHRRCAGASHAATLLAPNAVPPFESRPTVMNDDGDGSV